jgi:hypothetical protein
MNALAQTSFFVTDSWVINKLTLNLGARYDRYRAWLPAQTLPAGRFVPTTLNFAENSQVILFNNIVPRVGATYDVMGDGKTVLKANWGRFSFNTGVNLADAVNPNTSTQYAVWTWNDLNGDKKYQDNEKVGTAPTQQFGGNVSTTIDPNISNSYADEASLFVERSVLQDFGVRVGFVYKKDYNGWQQLNDSRPASAYNVPVTVADPGPDGSLATTADNGVLHLFNLDDTTRGTSNRVQNIADYDGNYKTLELSANKRYGNRWSMSASFSKTWTDEYGNTYFGNRFSSLVQQFSLFGSYPTNPNEPVHNEFTSWNSKISGTLDAGWGLRVTPVLKMQSGAPYGRFANIPACAGAVVSDCLNYGSQLVLVEPIGTRRQDTVSVLDFRVEKQLKFAQKARVGLFFDMFNAMNSNTAVNLVWQAGNRFEHASTVLGPRIAKFGAKFDW